MNKNNRIIKFRVWSLNEKRFLPIEAEYGQRIAPLFDIHFRPYCWASQHWGIDNELENKNEYIVQQFTGLLDKNGREIYEGDICKRKNWENVYYVRYSKDGYFWCGTHENDEQFYEYRDCLYDSDRLRNGMGECEIIGNIFENPELL